jgi:GGDEF domain-containing protein
MAGPLLIDPVTGLFDRMRFTALAEQEARRAVRYRHPMTFVVLALEGLGGPAEGEREERLRRAAAVLSDAVREHDLLSHLGEGVFAVGLTETGEAGAEVVARRLAERVGAAAGETARTALTVLRPEEEPAGLALDRTLARLAGSAVPQAVDHHVEEE